MKQYSVEEVAKIKGVNEETVRRWIRRGKLNATISSKKHGYKIDEIDVLNFHSNRSVDERYQRAKKRLLYLKTKIELMKREIDTLEIFIKKIEES